MAIDEKTIGEVARQLLEAEDNRKVLWFTLFAAGYCNVSSLEKT